MNPKVIYNPDQPTGQLYYIDGDLMLPFEYEQYKSGPQIAINIPLTFDESYRKERDEILNFIGKEVVRSQRNPSYYKIDNTSIVILKITTLDRMKSWKIQGMLAILLLILGLYMTNNGIVFGKELEYTRLHRRSLMPITGPLVIIVAIVWLINAYFKRKKNSRYP